MPKIWHRELSFAIGSSSKKRYLGGNDEEELLWKNVLMWFLVLHLVCHEESHCESERVATRFTKSFLLPLHRLQVRLFLSQ